MSQVESTLEKRLADLEKAHRRLKRSVGAIAASGIALALVGATQAPPGTAVAKSLHLVDEAGKVRILINPRAGVSLLDEEGRPRAVLSVDKSGPGLALYGTSSKSGTILNVNDDGPALAMRDNQGKTRALLTTIGAGPALIFSDEREKERIALIQQPDQSSLSMIDRKGRIHWRAP